MFSYILRYLTINGFKMAEAGARMSLRGLQCSRIILWPIKCQIYRSMVKYPITLPMNSEVPFDVLAESTERL